MEKTHQARMRGVVTLVLAGGLVAAFLAAPVEAALSTKKVRKIAAKEVDAYAAQNEGIYIASKAGPADTPDTSSTIASLSLPDGDYALFAKGWFLRSTADEGTLTCELFAGGASVDRGGVVLGAGNANAVISLLGSGGGGTVEIRCADGPPLDSTHRNVVLTAIRAPSLTKTTI